MKRYVSLASAMMIGTVVAHEKKSVLTSSLMASASPKALRAAQATGVTLEATKKPIYASDISDLEHEAEIVQKKNNSIKSQKTSIRSVEVEKKKPSKEEEKKKDATKSSCTSQRKGSVKSDETVSVYFGDNASDVEHSVSASYCSVSGKNSSVSTSANPEELEVEVDTSFSSNNKEEQEVMSQESVDNKTSVYSDNEVSGAMTSVYSDNEVSGAMTSVYSDNEVSGAMTSVSSDNEVSGAMTSVSVEGESEASFSQTTVNVELYTPSVSFSGLNSYVDDYEVQFSGDFKEDFEVSNSGHFTTPETEQNVEASSNADESEEMNSIGKKDSVETYNEEVFQGYYEHDVAEEADEDFSTPEGIFENEEIMYVEADGSYYTALDQDNDEDIEVEITDADLMLGF